MGPNGKDPLMIQNILLTDESKIGVDFPTQPLLISKQYLLYLNSGAGFEIHVVLRSASIAI